MPQSMKDKVALVTGGNAGIDKAIAVKFAEHGANFFITARRVPEGEDTVQKMIRQVGGDATFVRTDVTNPTQVEALVNTTVETYGGLHYAFNNAGVAGGEPIHEVSEETWD